MFVDLWKVMGVVISTLNDGEIVNLEGYGWDLGSNLQIEFKVSSLITSYKL